MKSILIGSKMRGRAQVPCGSGAPALLIANVGTSRTGDDPQTEIRKATAARKASADVITDHSFIGDLDRLHRALVDEVDALISYVSCYELAARLRDHAAGDAIQVLEAQMQRGIDLVTIHASYVREQAQRVAESPRLIPTTSKGGGILAAYMRRSGEENPYYRRFDEVLDLAKSYGVTLSLGTTFRAATTADPFDDFSWAELDVMGELAERASSHGVALMIEGFGHAALNEVGTLVMIGKAMTGGSPYRVLPMATDRALGLDHIAGAIGAAAAVQAGADLVCAMSRSEHIGLPTLEHLVEGVEATRVAIACGDLARGHHVDDERQMSRTRWTNGCKGDLTSAVLPEVAVRALEQAGRLADQQIKCGMCGDFCGITAGRASVSLGMPGYPS